MRNKRYLIVMDDIWNIEAWDKLFLYFPNLMNGSRVVITTRNKEIAPHANPFITPHELRFLNEMKSWEFFLKKIFMTGKITTICPP